MFAFGVLGPARAVFGQANAHPERADLRSKVDTLVLIALLDRDDQRVRRCQ